MSGQSAPRRAYADVMPPTRDDPRGEQHGEHLFQGDAGVLPEDVRRVLVQLLQGPYVSRDNHPRPWSALIGHEDVVRSRLGDLYLELMLDRDGGFAFIRKVTPEDVEVPGVVRSSRLTLIDTALLLHLRDQLLRAEAQDVRTIVGRDEIDDQLSVYRVASGTDPVTYAKRINAAIEKMKKNSILRPTAEADRFEISPILALVFGADEVLTVTRELRRLIGSQSAEVPDQSEPDEPEDQA